MMDAEEHSRPPATYPWAVISLLAPFCGFFCSIALAWMFAAIFRPSGHGYVIILVAFAFWLCFSILGVVAGIISLSKREQRSGMALTGLLLNGLVSALSAWVVVTGMVGGYARD